MEQVIGIVAGVCTSVALIPQLVKIFKTKSAKDVALFTLIILLIGQALWIVYGVMKSDTPIIATNAFSELVNVTTLVLRVKFGRN
jgi:MtN3 and saliva related transmembrane protein